MRFYELNEGISYKNCLDSFEFDFEHDNKTDIIKLTAKPIYDTIETKFASP